MLRSLKHQWWQVSCWRCWKTDSKILHFASTGKEFGYSECLAILTASKVHSVDEIWLWSVDEPLENHYFEKAKKIAEWHPTEVPSLPGEEGWTSKKLAAIRADYLRWAVLEDYGGMYLDLDTISIKDMMLLVKDKDVYVAPESFSENPNRPNWLGAHCVIAKAHSEVIKCAFDAMMSHINSHREHVSWGFTAPGALAKAYKEFGDSKMELLDYEVASPFLTSRMFDIWNEKAVIPEKARIIHVWHSVYADRLRKLTPKWIADSNCPYAAAVKMILNKNELGHIFTEEEQR